MPVPTRAGRSAKFKAAQRPGKHKRMTMKKYASALAALGAALSLVAFVPAAEAFHGGGGGGGFHGGFGGGHFGGGHYGGHGFGGGHVRSFSDRGFAGPRMVRNYGGHRGDWHHGGHGGHHHWHGGRWYGYGPGIYFGDPYYDDDYYDVAYYGCYWSYGRRECCFVY
jgi:hypothetical protein